MSIEVVVGFLQLAELPIACVASSVWCMAGWGNSAWATHYAALLRRRMVPRQPSTRRGDTAQAQCIPVLWSAATAELFPGALRRVTRALHEPSAPRTRRFPYKDLGTIRSAHITACGTELVLCHGLVNNCGVAHFAIWSGSQELLATYRVEKGGHGIMRVIERGKLLVAITGWLDGTVQRVDLRSGVCATRSFPHAVPILDVEVQTDRVLVAEGQHVSLIDGDNLRTLADRVVEGANVCHLRFCPSQQVVLVVLRRHGEEEREGGGGEEERDGGGGLLGGGGASVELWSSAVGDGLRRLRQLAVPIDVVGSLRGGVGPLADTPGGRSALLALNPKGSEEAAPCLFRLALEDAAHASPSAGVTICGHLPRGCEEVTALCVQFEDTAYVGCVDGSILIVDPTADAGGDFDSTSLRRWQLHSATVTAVSPLGDMLCSCSIDDRVVIWSMVESKITPLRYVECASGVWCMSATIHRAVFVDLSCAVTVVDLRRLPTLEEFGLPPGTAVRLVGLASRPDLNGAVGVVAAKEQQVPQKFARGRLGIELREQSSPVMVALANVRLQQ